MSKAAGFKAWRNACAAFSILLLSTVPWLESPSSPVNDNRSGLPAGSELGEDALTNPREIFHSEALRGHRSYLSNLGNLAFNSPYTLGEAARKARMSCATCHVNGASNPKLFIPGLSTHPGNFDTTGALFNPKADNGVLDPASIPSLRGARFLAPYGHDGRMASLRDFVRNVIVNEFAGAEPSSEMLDAMVAYIDDIDFLPNPRLAENGHLIAATVAEQRGAALFSKPFAHDPSLSCAACHIPSAAFVDHRQHDVGSGGLYKTPTLMNSDFNAPYFHDGRYGGFIQVIDHFDQVYALGLSAQDRTDLAAYLLAVGGGAKPEYRLSGGNVLADINGFASVLEIAIARHDAEVITLAVSTVTDMLADLSAQYPETADGNIQGAPERTRARAAVAALMQTLQRISHDAAAGKYDAAAAEHLNYRKLSFATVPLALQAAEPTSLFMRQPTSGANAN